MSFPNVALRICAALIPAAAMLLGAREGRGQDIGTGRQSAAWYLGAEGGWTALGNQEGHIPGKVFPQNFDDGYAIGLRAGYRLGPWRIEEEFRRQSNPLNHFARHPAEGYRTADALMTNAIYDVDLGWGITPHIGAGIGAVALHDQAAVAVLGIPNVDDGRDWVFGYQAIAGLRYRIASGLTVDLDYRYLATSTPQFTTAPGLIVDGVFTGNQRLASGYAGQMVLASVTWQFDAPAPSFFAAPGH